MTGIFTASTVLTASALNTAINSLTLNAQTGTTYTFVLADAGKLVTFTNASAITATIPLNSSVAYATGTRIECQNIGTTTVTLSPTGGVTLNGATTVAAGQRVQLTKTGTDTWYAAAVGGGGLSFITSATVSAGASLSVNNCFSSAFENYRILFSGLASADVNMTMRLRVGGADSSAATYNSQNLTANGATVSSAQSLLATSYTIGSIYTASGNSFVIDVFSPFATSVTSLAHQNSYTFSTIVYKASVGVFTGTTSFDGFTLIPSSGTITGTLRVYGYQN